MNTEDENKNNNKKPNLRCISWTTFNDELDKSHLIKKFRTTFKEKETKNKLIQNAKTSEHYIPNGSIYIFNYDILRKNKNYYTKKTAAYVMDDISSLDIDTMNDFNYCEFLSKKLKILN